MSQLLTATLPDSVTRTHLDTGRGRFACLEARPKGTWLGAVLLLPGLTGSKEDFAPLLPLLAAAGFRAVAVDQRGQYETPGPDDPEAYRPDQLAADVVALTAALSSGGDDGPVHLVGHSFGGFVAREAVIRVAAAEATATAAAADSQLPWASLALLNSGPSSPAHDTRQRIRLLIDSLVSLPKETLWLHMRPADADPDAEAVMRERWLRTAPQQLIGAGHWMLDPPSTVADLARCALPKLIVAGSPDETWSLDEFDAMVAELDAQHISIPGGEHSPAVHRPEATAEALTRFWATIR